MSLIIQRIIVRRYFHKCEAKIFFAFEERHITKYIFEFPYSISVKLAKTVSHGTLPLPFECSFQQANPKLRPGLLFSSYAYVFHTSFQGEPQSHNNNMCKILQGLRKGLSNLLSTRFQKHPVSSDSRHFPDCLAMVFAFFGSVKLATKNKNGPRFF